MAIAVGPSGEYRGSGGGDCDSVPSVRLMWWETFVEPVLYRTADSPPTYDSEAVYSCAPITVIPPPSRTLPPGTGNTYSTMYIDKYWTNTLAEGPFEREDWIEMSVHSARSMISGIRRRMTTIVDYYVGEVTGGRIENWTNDAGQPFVNSSPLAGDGMWTVFNFYSGDTSLTEWSDWLTLRDAIADAQLFYSFFKPRICEEREIPDTGQIINTIEAAATLLPGSWLPAIAEELALRIDAGEFEGSYERDPSGRIEFDTSGHFLTTDDVFSSICPEDYDPSIEDTEPGFGGTGTAPFPCPEEDTISELQAEIVEDCVYDPSATFIDWRTTPDPFLNSFECRYYVPIETEYSCPGADELLARVDEYFDQAVSALMRHLDKEYDPDTDAGRQLVTILREYVLESESYDFDKTPGQKLKLLYKIPFYLIKALRIEDMLPVFLDASAIPPSSFVLKGSTLSDKIERLNLALRNFSKMQGDLWYNDRTKIVREGTGIEVVLLQEALATTDLQSAIVDSLADNGYEIPTNNVRTSMSPLEIPNAPTSADEVLFMLSGDGRLVSLFARQQGAQFQRLGLSGVDTESPLRDSAIMSYLSRIDEIIDSLDREEPISLMGFLEAFHVPPIQTLVTDNIGNEVTRTSPQCAGRSPSSGANSATALAALESVGDRLASEFAKYACMTAEEIKQRDKLRAQSLKQQEEILSAEGLKNLVLSDPVIRNMSSQIQKISADAKGIEAAWEKLFNKLTACGLLKLMLDTVQFISKSDVCGISPEKALKSAISSILQNTDTSKLEMLFNSIPFEFSEPLRTAYMRNIGSAIEQSGYSGGSVFPWQYEQERQVRQQREDRGVLLYVPQEFYQETPSEAQNNINRIYSRGRNRDFGAEPSMGASRYEMEAFWNGYLNRAMESFDSPSYTPLSVSDVQLSYQDSLNGGRELSNASSAQLQTALLENFASSLTDIVPTNLLLDLTKDIPVVGTLLKTVDTVAKCNTPNLNSSETPEKEKSKGIGKKQDNLESGGPPDLCGLFGGFKPITQPSMNSFDFIKKDFNIQTIWSAMMDAILDAIKAQLLSILIKTLVQLISTATGALEGLCRSLSNPASLAQADAGAVIEATGIMNSSFGGIFEAAFCSDDATLEAPTSVTATINQMIDQITGPLGPSDGEGLGTPSDLIDTLGSQMTMPEMLSLLTGNAEQSTINQALTTIQSSAPQYASLLYDRTSVRGFFSTVGAAFPAGFLEQAQSSLSRLGADTATISSTCAEDNTAWRDEVARTLREECGDQISEAQIEAQLANLENSAQGLISNFASTLGGGMHGLLSESIGSAIEASLPRDEPGNLVIAEEVIDTLFSSFYVTYARDLMQPLRPNGNAGLVNMILSNRDAMPQRAQLNFLNMMAAFSNMASGLPADDSEPGPPVAPDPLGALFGLAARAGAQALFDDRLPSTVAEYLRGIFQSGAYISEEVSDTESGGEISTLDFNFDENLLFRISYNFFTGVGTINYYAPPLPLSEPIEIFPFGETEPFTFSTDENVSILSQLDNLIYGPRGLDEVYRTHAPAVDEDTILSPLNMGSALLMRHYEESLLLAPAITETSGYDPILSDTRFLVQDIRSAMFRVFSRSIADNSNAFIYGEYTSDRLRDEEVLPIPGSIPPVAPPGTIEAGYTVVYLDDGRIYVRPPRKHGWLEIKDILLPPEDDEFCCPERKELFNVEYIKERTLTAYRNLSDDPRLFMNPRTVEEPPYAKILARMPAAGLEGVIITTIRTYIIEALLKGVATFSKFKTDIPETFNDTLVAYIAGQVRSGLKRQGPNAGAPVRLYAVDGSPRGTLRHGYWYEFLEQAVQVYSKRIMAGTTDVTPAVDRAMRTLQDEVAAYQYPQKSDLRAERLAAAAALGADPISLLAISSLNLKQFRKNRKLDVLQKTEEEAMVVLRKLVADEFNVIAQDIASIFPAPPGDWVSNVYMDFLNNTYNIGARNIFDIPRGDENRLLPNTLDPIILAADFEDGQYVLESYVRVVRNADGLTLFPDLEDDAIYGINELQGLIGTALLAAITSGTLTGEEVAAISANSVRDYFEIFRYGLRLTYVPSVTLMGELPSLRSQIAARSEVVTNRLFDHVPFAADSHGDSGRYSIPIVFSENVEQIYSSSIADFTTIDLSSASTTSVSQLNWPLAVGALMSSEEFRMFFQYAVPLPSILTLLSVYNVEAFLRSMGHSEDEWAVPPPVLPLPFDFLGIPVPAIGPPGFRNWNQKVFPVLRRQLKKTFVELYNSDNFAYREEALGTYARREVNDIREESDLDTLETGLSPSLRGRIIVDNPLSLCDVSPAETVEGEVARDSYEGDIVLPEEPPPYIEADSLVCVQYRYDTAAGTGGALSEIMTYEQMRELDALAGYRVICWSFAPDTVTTEDIGGAGPPGCPAAEDC